MIHLPGSVGQGGNRISKLIDTGERRLHCAHQAGYPRCRSTLYILSIQSSTLALRYCKTCRRLGVDGSTADSGTVYILDGKMYNPELELEWDKYLQLVQGILMSSTTHRSLPVTATSLSTSWPITSRRSATSPMGAWAPGMEGEA